MIRYWKVEKHCTTMVNVRNNDGKWTRNNETTMLKTRFWNCFHRRCFAILSFIYGGFTVVSFRRCHNRDFTIVVSFFSSLLFRVFTIVISHFHHRHFTFSSSLFRFFAIVVSFLSLSWFRIFTIVTACFLPSGVISCFYHRCFVFFQPSVFRITIVISVFTIVVLGFHWRCFILFTIVF